jgi:acyl dehydratase
MVSPTLPVATHCEHIGTPLLDLRVGDLLPVKARRTVTDFDSVAISTLAMNTHPLHTDYAYARSTPFVEPLVVSPFLLSTLVAFVANELREVEIHGLEVTEVSFGRPVHPGDTVTAEAQVEEIAPERMRFLVAGKNAAGEQFAQFRLAISVRPV